MHGWNAAHADPEEVEPPSAEKWEAEQRRILANPALTQG